MNHEEAVLFHTTLTNSLPLTGVRTSLSPRPFPIDEEYYTAKLIFLTLRSRWHDEEKKKKKRNERRKDAIINNFMFQSAYLSRGGGRIRKKSGTGKKNGAGRSNRLQIALLFFFFLYHEMLPIIMKRVNWILFFFFFHLSNNWFDISEHFKGSLARRRRSKLQYKAEDLPLAECQVYARALASPSPSIFLPLLPSLSLSIFSPQTLWNTSQTLHNLSPPPLFVCVCVRLVSRSCQVYCNTIKARCVYQ